MNGTVKKKQEEEKNIIFAVFLVFLLRGETAKRKNNNRPRSKWVSVLLIVTKGMREKEETWQERRKATKRNWVFCDNFFKTGFFFLFQKNKIWEKQKKKLKEGKKDEHELYFFCLKKKHFLMMFISILFFPSSDKFLRLHAFFVLLDVAADDKKMF